MGKMKRCLGGTQELTRSEIADRIRMANAPDRVQGERRHDSNEDELIEALDEKALMIEMMREALPVFKRMRRLQDAEGILQMQGPAAAKMLGKLMWFGEDRVKMGAIKEILDRNLGKPVERQMNLNADVGRLKEVEVDREIARLFGKLGSGNVGDIVEVGGDGSVGEEGVVKVVEDQGAPVRRDDTGEV